MERFDKAPAAIVVLTGYADIFGQFRESADIYEPEAKKIAVLGNGLEPAACGASAPEWEFLQDNGAEFSFPRNANLGIRAADPCDVLLVNDDVSFLAPNSLKVLRDIAHSDADIGILSPQLHGFVGNPLQMAGTRLNVLTYSSARLCFTCVYLKRSVLDLVGELDERFGGYGCDDDDYCKRVRLYGLRLAVTPEVVLRHGFGASRSTSSFDRLHANRSSLYVSQNLMREAYRAKWGVLP